MFAFAKDHCNLHRHTCRSIIHSVIYQIYIHHYARSGASIERRWTPSFMELTCMCATDIHVDTDMSMPLGYTDL